MLRHKRITKSLIYTLQQMTGLAADVQSCLACYAVMSNIGSANKVARFALWLEVLHD